MQLTRTPARPRIRALASAGAVLLAALALILVSRSPVARAASVSGLQGQISAKQSKVSALSGELRLTGAQLAKLDGQINGLEQQIGVIQRRLQSDRARLFALQSQLTLARAKLSRLEQFQAHAEQVLSRQLVSSYETDAPDLISVVLEATGFNDLLERLSFAKRIRSQDVRVTTAVRDARRQVADQAIALGALELRQERLTAQVLRSSDSLNRARIALVRNQLRVARAHASQARALGAARAQVRALNGQLAALQAAQAQAAAQAAQQSSQQGAATGAVLSGTPAGSAGGFTFPLPKGSVSPPSTWTLDQGVDMAAPGDTPEFAVCSGTIVQHGIGGFGPWAPILHCDSPVGGYSYVYYGHAGPNGQVPIGTHVSAGQVMSSIGPGIVGMSTGPHIEIGFAGADGSLVGGSSTMMSLLNASY